MNIATPAEIEYTPSPLQRRTGAVAIDPVTRELQEAASFGCAEIDPRRARYFRYQEVASRIAAAILLLLALPVIVITVLAVKITSPGPGIYRQIRAGMNGRPFTMLKIRTMRRDAEAQTGPVWAAPHDDRVTPLGRYLRRSHLDELPQLVNVVLGQMSLIGPRPERPELVAKLVRQVPNYADRLAVRPGVTGLAQVELPPDHGVEDVQRKLLVDLEYIERANWRLDSWILVRTALHLFGFGRPLSIPQTNATVIAGRISDDSHLPHVRRLNAFAAHESRKQGPTSTKDDREAIRGKAA